MCFLSVDTPSKNIIVSVYADLTSWPRSRRAPAGGKETNFYAVNLAWWAHALTLSAIINSVAAPIANE